jgi:hypothetical protein
MSGAPNAKVYYYHWLGGHRYTEVDVTGPDADPGPNALARLREMERVLASGEVPDAT